MSAFRSPAMAVTALKCFSEALACDRRQFAGADLASAGEVSAAGESTTLNSRRKPLLESVPASEISCPSALAVQDWKSLMRRPAVGQELQQERLGIRVGDRGVRPHVDRRSWPTAVRRCGRRCGLPARCRAACVSCVQIGSPFIQVLLLRLQILGDALEREHAVQIDGHDDFAAGLIGIDGRLLQVLRERRRRRLAHLADPAHDRLAVCRRHRADRLWQRVSRCTCRSAARSPAGPRSCPASRAHAFHLSRREVFVEFDDRGFPKGLHEFEVDLRRQDETRRLRRHAHQPGLKCLARPSRSNSPSAPRGSASPSPCSTARPRWPIAESY